MTRPNILFITTHDTGRHFGCYGNPTVNSPAVDRLAAEGVRFSNCFCAAPKCSPSRAAMMTGRWPQANGVLGLTHAPHWWEYNPDERHLAAVLREAGYATHLFHFQHETEDLSRLGFDEFHAMPAPHGSDEMPEPYVHRPAAEVAAEFAAFCGRPQPRPFFVQVGFFETHNPLPFGGNTGDDSCGVTVPAYWADTAPTREFFRMLQGAVRQVDAAVGVMIEALAANGLDDNTLVVFTVDHGLSYARAKGTLYDKGLEVALVMRWPCGGVRGGRICDRLLSNIDVFPTVLELAGIPVPANVHGIGSAESARGEEPRRPPRDAVFGLYQCGPVHRCIRTARHKLIVSFSGHRLYDVPVDPKQARTQAGPAVELHDLETDPMETHNLAGVPEHAGTRQALLGRLIEHLRVLNDPILTGPIPDPYYLRAVRELGLPAGAGKATAPSPQPQPQGRN